jgi:hypothetical protein
MSRPRASLFVLDTGPLITLAAADSLDYLLYPNVPVIIPDAVFYEATRDSAKLGAQSIIEWVKAHHEQVEIAVTNTYINFDAARSVNPNAYEPNLGEQASVEVIEEPRRLQGDEKAVLLCEETMVTRRIVVRERERIIELSTMDFLKLLEAEQRIQSADAVFDRALAAGRTPSRVEKFSEHDPALRDAVRDTLGTARQGPPPRAGGPRRRKS